MIDYIGDVSRQDAELLRALAEDSDAILEFGCGASTQILAAYGSGTVDSVDTDPEWIEKTKRNLAALRGKHRPVVFHRYESFRPTPGYELIFVDGRNDLRLEFALMTWPSLALGGVMCFHDTRRTKPHGRATLSDVQMVCAVVERHSEEIEFVALNQNRSNTTVITKCAPLLLEDYNAIEGRTPEQLGLA